MFGGFESVGDMFDGGGPGASGGSFSGGPFDSSGSSGGGGLMSSIGGLIGMAMGGPAGAAIGSGLGSLVGGGNINDAFTAGLSNFGIGSMTGMGGMMTNVAGAMGGGGDGRGTMGGKAGQTAQQGLFKGSGLAGVLQGAGGLLGAPGAGAQPGAVGGLPGILANPMAQNLILAGLIEANEPKPVTLTPGQQATVATGERSPNYRGTAAPGTPSRTVNMAQGGYVEGPGTGKSDSIPAAIYQDGGRVQEARLSDGEFVMTADAVRGAGGGNRNEGAAKMYELMEQYERRAGAR